MATRIPPPIARIIKGLIRAENVNMCAISFCV